MDLITVEHHQIAAKTQCWINRTDLPELQRQVRQGQVGGRFAVQSITGEAMTLRTETIRRVTITRT